jgi:hypothetical protein
LPKNAFVSPSLAGLGHHMDTSGIKAATLREWVRQFIAAENPRTPARG